MFVSANSQQIQLSDQAQVSLLTCDVGDELYTLYGHSAIRVSDPKINLDYVYNWGMFDFNDPDFNTKFLSGQLLYFMAKMHFSQFMFEYEQSERSVSEQVLNLNPQQVQEMWFALEENALPENKYYHYDFFYDNCSTKIPELLKKVIGKDLSLGKHKDANDFSYRQLVNQRTTRIAWVGLGMDFIMGSSTDAIATNEGLTFLPIYLEEILDQSKINSNGVSEPFVKEKKQLVKGSKREASFSFSDPIFIFWMVLLVCLTLGIFRIRFLTYFWFGTILFLCSALGIFLIWLILNSDLTAFGNNYNLIWAHPLHLMIIVGLFSKKFGKRFERAYIYFSLFYLGVALFWIILPQELPSGFRPLILSLTIVYYYLHRYHKTANG